MPDLPWFVYAMLLAPLGLILAVAVYKTLQVRAAREWPSAGGRWWSPEPRCARSR
jgi:hypothetical protein